MFQIRIYLSFFAVYPIHVHDDYDILFCVCNGFMCSGFECYGHCRDPDYPDIMDYDCMDEAEEMPEGVVYQDTLPNFRLMGILCEEGISSFA